VRNLAPRSAEAAKQIEALTEQAQSLAQLVAFFDLGAGAARRAGRRARHDPRLVALDGLPARPRAPIRSVDGSAAPAVQDAPEEDWERF
jgi:hypothetical protein